MAVINKTMEITEDRRSRLDLKSPESPPTGPAEPRLTINPLPPHPGPQTL
jgi:hypothetical protein